MKNFKTGQNVVFDCEGILPYQIFKVVLADCGYPCPNNKEIVTVAGESVKRPGWYFLAEYPKSVTGKRLAFSENVLFPLNEIHAAETEKLLAGIGNSVYEIKDREHVNS